MRVVIRHTVGGEVVYQTLPLTDDQVQGAYVRELQTAEVHNRNLGWSKHHPDRQRVIITDAPPDETL